LRLGPIRASFILSPPVHPMKPRRCLFLLAFAACIATLSPPLCATSLTWDTVDGDGATITGGSGTWDTSTINWNSGAGNTSWVNANKDLAIFSGTAGTVSLGSDITASGVTFSSGYTIGGAGFTLTLDNGASPAVISKNASGTISANLASSGAVSINPHFAALRLFQEPRAKANS
jgi:hypothetical protein